MKNKKNIALIGVGRWGKNHLKTLSSIKDVNKIFVVDSNPNFDQQILSNYKNAVFFENLNKLFNKDYDINGAIIATPPQTHYEIAKKCLLNGLHVLIEKPVVETVSELDELNNIATKNKKLIMAGHILLYHSAIKKIKEIIDQGTIGEIKFIHSQRLNFGVVRNDIDVFLSLAPHDISLVQFFLDNKKYISMSSNRSNFSDSLQDDYSSTLLKYNGDVSAQIDVGWFYPTKIQSLKIIGSKKTIIFDDVSKIIKIIDMSINKNLEHFSNGEDIIDFDKSELPLTSEIKSFLSYFDAPDHCITGYSHTRNVIKIFEEYYKNRKFIS